MSAIVKIKQINTRLIFIIFTLSLITSFAVCSCSSENNNKRIVYEIPDIFTEELEKQLEKFSKNDIVVVINKDSKREEVTLCFKRTTPRLIEVSKKTNRFLKITDKIQIPVVFSEDFIFVKSHTFLESTGCNLTFTIACESIVNENYTK